MSMYATSTFGLEVDPSVGTGGLVEAANVLLDFPQLSPSKCIHAPQPWQKI